MWSTTMCVVIQLVLYGASVQNACKRLFASGPQERGQVRTNRDPRRTVVKVGKTAALTGEGRRDDTAVSR